LKLAIIFNPKNCLFYQVLFAIHQNNEQKPEAFRQIPLCPQTRWLKSQKRQKSEVGRELLLECGRKVIKEFRAVGSLHFVRMDFSPFI
jgi:hypothetical protein